MGKKTQPSADAEEISQDRGGLQSARHPLKPLETRFEEFRQSHAAGTRIPDDLRRNAVSWVQQGFPRRQVQQACRISGTQLLKWQENFGEAPARNKSSPRARILAVQKEALQTRAGPTEHSSPQTLELRLDGWSIRIRPVATSVQD